MKTNIEIKREAKVAMLLYHCKRNSWNIPYLGNRKEDRNIVKKNVYLLYDLFKQSVIRQPHI